MARVRFSFSACLSVSNAVDSDVGNPLVVGIDQAGSPYTVLSVVVGIGVQHATG